MKSIPKIALLTLGALSLIIGILFYVGGTSGSIEVGGDSIDVPTYTETLIVWSYILIGLTLFFTLGAVVLQFVEKVKKDSKSAIKSVAAVAALVVILLISFAVGTSEIMTIVGYEGTDNSGFWAQFSDMCLNSMYFLIGVAALAAVGSSVYGYIRK